MTEREPRDTLGKYGIRPEYNASTDEYLEFNNVAIESIEDVMSTDAKSENSTMYSMLQRGCVLRELSVSYTDPAIGEIYCYRDGDDLLVHTWERRAVATEVFMWSEMTTGAIRTEVAKVAIREFVYGERDPIVTDYVFEKYQNNVVRATVARMGLEAGPDPESYLMTPYDFREFAERMQVVAAMRSGMLVGDGAMSDEE